MRLRQAHAILKAGTALEAAGLGFSLTPFDYDDPNAVGPPPDDYLTGYAEFNDPDYPDTHTRIYSVDLRPGPNEDFIEVSLAFGYNEDSLFHAKFSVTQPDPDEEGFRGLVGAQIAQQVAEKVRKNEKRYKAEYQRRAAGLAGGEQ